MHPWKPRFATAVSALQIVAAASLLQGSKGEQEIHVYQRQITEIEVHEIINSENYGLGIGLALMMLGTIMIIVAIYARLVQAKKRRRRLTPKGESGIGATEDAPQAASQAPSAYQETSASEDAPQAASQARVADLEPSPQSSCSSSSQKTLKQNTAQPRAEEPRSSSRKIFYSRDGMKVGIYHTSRNCGNLKSAKAIF